MKSPTRRTDRIFAVMLSVCAAVMILSAIAWACGWEYGAFLLVIAGAMANVPMFHFAMHWPFRDRNRDRKNPDE